MKLATERGHMIFGAFWTVCVLVIVVGFSGVGGLRFAPWFLLLLPFAAIRLVSSRMDAVAPGGVRPVLIAAANAIVELLMVIVFVYLYNLAVLSYCPLPR